MFCDCNTDVFEYCNIRGQKLRYEVVPSPSNLKGKLNELYNAQTILVDTYADVPGILKTLGNMELGFCLVSIRDPRKFDFRCLLAKNLVGGSKAACLVRMPPLLSLQRDDVLKSIMKVAFPLFYIVFIFGCCVNFTSKEDPP